MAQSSAACRREIRRNSYGRSVYPARSGGTSQARPCAVCGTSGQGRRRLDYRGLLRQLNGVEFDAVYLSTGSEPGARALQQLRHLGLRRPVFGSDTLKAILAKLRATAELQSAIGCQ
jgi:hypothetical protein